MAKKKEEKAFCVCGCGKEVKFYPKDVPAKDVPFYIEGVGQLSLECHKKLYGPKPFAPE